MRNKSFRKDIMQRSDSGTHLRPTVKVQLGEGVFAYIEVDESSAARSGADAPTGRQSIASLADRTVGQFRSLADSIRAVAAEMRTAIDAVAPSEAEIEFGVEATVGTDGLMALIVKGEGSANFKVRMKWVHGDD